MSFHNRILGVTAACAALALPAISRAQLPTWSFAMLDTTPSVTATTGVTPFDRVTNPALFGTALPAGLPPDGLPPFTFTFTQGAVLTPGKVEIGGVAKNTDPAASGSTIVIMQGPIDQGTGPIPLNDDDPLNIAKDFFEQNTADLTMPTGDPTWNGAQIASGNSLTLDLGTLDLNKLLAYYDAQGPGTYDLTMDIGVEGYTINGDPLDPDPTTGAEVARVPGPPTVRVQVIVNPAAPPPDVPEPGAVAMLAGMAIAGGASLFRRRRAR